MLLCLLSLVESYNPVSNQWTSHPPLKQRKGSFSVLSLKDSIFVFGGGNGVECFSEVEMFDPNTGRWIPIQSLLHKVFFNDCFIYLFIFFASSSCWLKLFLL